MYLVAEGLVVFKVFQESAILGAGRGVMMRKIEGK